MIRACLSASQRMRRTTRTVMAPLSAAPSATVANSSSASGTEPVSRTRHAVVRRQAQRGDRRPNDLGRLAAGLEIAVIEHRLDVDEPPQFRWPPAPGRKSAFARKRTDASPAGPPRRRRRWRRPPARCPRGSSCLSSMPSIDCEMAPRTPRSVGSAASVRKKRLRLDQLGRVCAAPRRRRGTGFHRGRRIHPRPDGRRCG